MKFESDPVAAVGCRSKGETMREVLRTNDPVLLSFVEALLEDAGIPVALADVNMSVLEGSIGVLPRRLLVGDGDADEALRLIGEIEHGSLARQDTEDGA